MGENSKINQQSKCVLKQVQTALMNDENNDIGFKATYLHNDSSYRNSNTCPLSLNKTKSSLNKLCFISTYAYDLVKKNPGLWYIFLYVKFYIK